MEKSCNFAVETLEKSCKMLNRKVTKSLENWYNSRNRKAALLTGARQVGKTTAVREFAKIHYKHFVEVNFVKRPIARKAFDGDLDTSTIISYLSAMGFGPFIEHETLIFLDEIQECPNARTAIKFLVEENKYDYIESGSLLGINYKEVPSYPVGFEQEFQMYPLDFEEFLWAKGIKDDTLSILKKSFDIQKPVPEFIHNQINKYFREYLVVGGMPEVVQAYVDYDDFRYVTDTQKSILTTYRAYISKYAGKNQTLVKRIFDAIPSQLGKQDKRFILADIEHGASRRKYEDPTQWLIDAGIAYYSFNTAAFELPFEATENRKLYKLYTVDIGLLSRLLLNGLQFNVMNGDIDINEGALTENAVACALTSNSYSLHYYDRKSKQELDFIIEKNNKINIIEVKSGDDYTRHASLDAAIKLYADKIGQSIVLCKSNVYKDKDILYLPLYMAMYL